LLELAEEFRAYASNGGQVFISTHSPDFVNGWLLGGVVLAVSGKQRLQQVVRAADDPYITEPGG
jgi:predicted ATPase